jgi:hypothetical protein
MHPVVPFVAAVALAPIVGAMGRRVLSIVAPLVSLWLLSLIQDGATVSVITLGHEWILWNGSRLTPCRSPRCASSVDLMAGRVGTGPHPIGEAGAELVGANVRGAR